jgi:bifunctional non-homologous end joining protein LigD
MLATLAREVPTGPEWVFEEKYDGIRALAERRAGRVRLWSRNGLDLTAGAPAVADAVRALPGGDLLLDGELVVLDRAGVSRFQLLQRRGGGARTDYAVFDLLRLDGRSVVRRPLDERRAALERLVPARGPVRLSRRLRGGAAGLARARRAGWEGIIAKDRTAPYASGERSRSWLKVKVRRESEFVIGGYTAPAGARAHLGALLVGLYDGERLRYAGKVGSGYSGAVLDDLAARLAPLRRATAPFADPPRITATWVRPVLVAHLAFAEWTADGKLRQPVFLGLRPDTAARDCRWSERET